MTMSNQSPNFLLHLIENFLKCFVMDYMTAHMMQRSSTDNFLPRTDQLLAVFQQGLALTVSQVSGVLNNVLAFVHAYKEKQRKEIVLTIYTLAAVCIFSLLLSTHFLRCRKGEFVQQSGAFSVSDHFLHSGDLNV